MKTRAQFADQRRISEIKLSNILVPVDFTRDSAKQFQYALAMAKAHHAKITILHVTPSLQCSIDCGYGPVKRQVPDEEQLKEDRVRLKRIVANHIPSDYLAGIRGESGKPVEQIVHVAQEIEANLIILVSHEELDPACLGSHRTAEKIIRQATCPVLVIRAHEKDFLESPSPSTHQRLSGSSSRPGA